MSARRKGARAIVHLVVAMLALGVVYASTPRVRSHSSSGASSGAPVAAASPANPTNVQAVNAPCVPTLWIVDSGQYFSVDIATGATTPVAPLDPAYPFISRLRFAPDGTLYGYKVEGYPNPGRRLRVDILTGAVTDAGPGFDVEYPSTGIVEWFAPGYLPEGSASLGIQLDHAYQNPVLSGAQRIGSMRTIRALEPYAFALDIPYELPLAWNTPIGNAVSRDGLSSYFVTVDTIYRLPLTESPAKAVPHVLMGVLELSADARVSDTDDNDHLYIVDGITFYDIDLVAKTRRAVRMSGINMATEVMIRRCPSGGVRISPTQGLVTSHLGSPATFEAVLTAPPSADVTFDLASSSAAEGTVSPSTLTFTAGDWNVPKTLTVAGTGSGQNKAAVPYSIITTATTSTDANYANRHVADVQVTNLHPPALTAGSATTFCDGGSVTLTSSSATNRWYRNGNLLDGETGPQLLVTLSGDYTAEATLSGVVSGPATPVVVTVHPLPAAPAITANGSTSFCAGSSVTLTSSAAMNPQWYFNGSAIPGATAQSYVAAASGSYTVTTTDGNGCESLPATPVSVTVHTDPDATITAATVIGTSTAGHAASVADAGAGATYTWSIDNGTITGGAGTASITYTAGGAGPLTLDVTVSSAAGCLDSGSATVDVTATEPPATHLLVTAPDGVTHGVPFNITVTALGSGNGLATGYRGTVTFTSSSSGTLPADYTYVSGDNGSHTFSVTLTDDLTQSITVTDTSVASITGTDETFVSPVIAGSCSSGSLYALIDENFYSVNPTTGARTYVSTITDPTYQFRTLHLRYTPDGRLIGRANGQRLLVRIEDGSVTPIGPDVDAAGSDGSVAEWLPPAYLAEGNAAAGYQANRAADWTSGRPRINDADFRMRRIDSVTPWLRTTETLSFQSPAGQTHSNAVSHAITRDGKTFYRIGTDALYTADLSAPSPAFVRTMDLSAYGLTMDDRVTNLSENGHIFISRWNSDDLYVLDPVIQTMVLTSSVPYGLDLIWRPCPLGGVIISPEIASVPMTSESGSTVTAGFALTNAPTADVTFAVSSSDTGEGTVSPSTLTFTAANWNVPQTVTVTGVPDTADDGTQPYTIVTSLTSSADPEYNGRFVPNVAIENTDVDTAGAAFSPASLTVTAGGSAVPLTISLSSRPSADVTIPLSISNGPAALSASSVTFTSADWSPRQVEVSAPAGAATGAFAVVAGNVFTSDPVYVGVVMNDASGTITASADLAVAKSAPAAVTAGTNLAVSVTLTNAGPSNAANVSLADAVPAGTLSVSAIQNSGPAFTCNASGCTAASFAPGTATFTFTYAVPASAANGSLVGSTATVSSGTTDAQSGNDAAAASSIVATEANLGVVNTADSSVVAGSDLSYSITLTNSGPSDATGVTFGNPQPAHTTFVSLTQNSGATFNCTTDSGVSCSLATLAAGASASFTIVQHVASSAPAGTVIESVASVSSATSDSANGNNSSTSQATVSTLADVAVTKSGPAAISAGSAITYTVTVTNGGPSDAQNVALTDTAPSGVAFVSTTQDSGPPFDCTGTSTVTCSIATLAASATATFTLVDAVSPSAANGTTVTNTASVTSTTTDAAGTNNSQSTSAIVAGPANTSVTISGPPTILAGTNITYTLSVANDGPSDAQSVALSVTLPAGLTLVSLAQTAGSSTFVCGSGACSAAMMAPSASATFSLVAATAANVPNGTTLETLAAVVSDNPDPDSSNNAAAARTTVMVAADTTPEAFTFIDQIGVALATVTTSNAITVSGINTAAPVSVTGGEYEVNASGSWTSSAGTVNDGDTVRVRHTSSAGHGTTLNTTLTIGSVSDTFSSTTIAAPEAVDGTCGAAAGVATAFAPSVLCASGLPGSVADGSPWMWECTGTDGGATATCSAPNQTLPTGGAGRATVSGGSWAADVSVSAGFIPTTGHLKSPPDLPAGYDFPHALFDFTLIGGGAGTAATVTITYPNTLRADSVYWKYGPTAENPLPHWYVLPTAVVSGNRVTLTIIDGGLGDDDLIANGIIVDQGGPGEPDVASIPTLSEWMALLLFVMLTLLAARRLGSL